VGVRATRLQNEIWLITLSKVMGTSDHSRYLGWQTLHLLACELLLPHLLIGVRSTEDVVNLLVSFGEVALWVFKLLILINLFGRLENFICETL
jgi:hypothetical protein